jgi:isoleucyl-tRNA synthetase
VRGIRRKVNIKVRQPLQKMLIPALTQEFRTRIEAVAPLILSEVNVKEIEFISPESGQIVKKIKPDFRALGPRLGAKMKEAAAAIAALSQADIAALERNGEITISIANEPFVLNKTEVEITTQDIPGWSVATEGGITVALDITVTDSLRNEGIARDLINRIQNIRKELDFEVTDHIQIVLLKQPAWADALSQFGSYIQAETLCTELIVTDSLTSGMEIDIDEVKSVITLKQL